MFALTEFFALSEDLDVVNLGTVAVWWKMIPSGNLSFMTGTLVGRLSGNRAKYACETRPVAFKEEYIFRVFEIKLMKIFGSRDGGGG